MEEDIKILEEFLCTSHLSFGDATRCALALRRIKDRYRELEEDNKILKANGFRQGLYEKDCGYIPKSKIKEKIEELEKEPLKIKQNNKYYFETDAYNKIIIQVLQELIED